MSIIHQHARVYSFWCSDLSAVNFWIYTLNLSQVNLTVWAVVSCFWSFMSINLCVGEGLSFLFSCDS